MDSASQMYPDYLNPFGSDDEGVEDSNKKPSVPIIKADDYPDYLSPFGDDEDVVSSTPQITSIDEYDDSLNPFGDENESMPGTAVIVPSINNSPDDDEDLGEGNPFAEDNDESHELENHENKSPEQIDIVVNTKSEDEDKLQQEGESSSKESKEIIVKEKEFDRAQKQTAGIAEQNSVTSNPSPQPDSLDPPPIPLPRTKSLLKKKYREQQQALEQQAASDLTRSNSLLSTTSSTSSLSTTPTNKIVAPVVTLAGLFQRKKNKRIAPPVPSNIQRQVSSSLDAIKEELNDIGDKLSMIEKESILCQQSLKENNSDSSEYQTSRSKFIELTKRKNSFVKRQKELLTRKRELTSNKVPVT